MEDRIEYLKTTLYLVIGLLGLKISLHMTDNNDELLLRLSIMTLIISVIMEVYLCCICKEYRDTNEYKMKRKEIRTYLVSYAIVIAGAIFSLTL